ncbi:MAG: N-6 DNA methylase [Gemmatimonadaceae bacterium]
MKNGTLKITTQQPQSLLARGSTTSGRFSQLDATKLRGGYYTPTALADWLCAWAIRSKNDLVLEPSCGDGAFLEAASKKLRALGSRDSVRAGRLLGVEVIPAEATKATARLRVSLGASAAGVVATDDFFAWWKRPDRPLVDAVVGNPPFIRYQSFPEPSRNRAMSIMQELGLRPNRLTNIWVPFVVAAAASLRPGGRMALVIPAELLQVSYASQLRSFLTNRFGRIDLITCNELFFENAEQEVLLLLADDAKARPSKDNVCRMTLTETRTVADLVSRRPSDVLRGAESKSVHHASEKWLKFFLTGAEIDFMRRLRASSRTNTLAAFASVDVGVVTGKNKFFVLNEDAINEHNLSKYTVPLVSRSSHLAGAKIGRKEWQQLASAGDLVHLLHLAPRNGGKLPLPLSAYIKAGEDDQLHMGYKCSIRKPWYAVPSVWVPDAFMFRQIYDFPRVVLNGADATSTDTIHRMNCKVKPALLLANLYTHLTAASAEIEGRSYGGGVLELEPTEAERLLVPMELGAALPLSECDRLVRAGRLDEILLENDRRVLMDQMGLSRSDCRMLRRIWEKMRDRRLARRRTGRPSTA